MTTVTDVEKALIDAREVEDYWINKGWESLQLEEETMILDIFASVQRISENVDPVVWIHIELEEKMYIVPLEDVSAIHINDSLVIGVEDLYPDWLNRVESRLEEVDIIHHLQTFTTKGKDWDRYTYLSAVDDKVRIVLK